LINEKWKVLVKAAKLFAKKLIAIQGLQPPPALPTWRSSRETCTHFFLRRYFRLLLLPTIFINAL
jgi:hypothetical protein